MPKIDPSASPVNHNPSPVAAHSALPSPASVVDAVRPAALDAFALASALAEALTALPASQIPEKLQPAPPHRP